MQFTSLLLLIFIIIIDLSIKAKLGKEMAKSPLAQSDFGDSNNLYIERIELTAYYILIVFIYKSKQNSRAKIQNIFGW